MHSASYRFFVYNHPRLMNRDADIQPEIGTFYFSYVEIEIAID